MFAFEAARWFLFVVQVVFMIIGFILTRRANRMDDSGLYKTSEVRKTWFQGLEMLIISSICGVSSLVLGALI